MEIASALPDLNFGGNQGNDEDEENEGDDESNIYDSECRQPKLDRLSLKVKFDDEEENPLDMFKEALDIRTWTKITST